MTNQMNELDKIRKIGELLIAKADGKIIMCNGHKSNVKFETMNDIIEFIIYKQNYLDSYTIQEPPPPPTYKPLKDLSVLAGKMLQDKFTKIIYMVTAYDDSKKRVFMPNYKWCNSMELLINFTYPNGDVIGELE